MQGNLDSPFSSHHGPAHLAARSALALGFLANVLLSGLKTAVGILGHSPALLAEGINSTSDVAYYAVVSFFMRVARKPPDREHPFGHGQLESIAALVVGAFVLTTGVAVFWNAVNDVFDLLIGESAFQGATAGALGTALLTVGLKIFLTAFTLHQGKTARSAVVTALARDHRNDVLSASAAAVGIYMGRAGYLWVDPLAGALVALFILHTGFEILRDASVAIMQSVPDEDTAARISHVLKGVEGIRTIEAVHALHFGPYLVVNVTIGVDPQLTVAQGDSIASEAERRLYQEMDAIRHVHIHFHPAATG